MVLFSWMYDIEAASLVQLSEALPRVSLLT
jgi:hypothetical protein